MSVKLVLRKCNYRHVTLLHVVKSQICSTIVIVFFLTYLKMYNLIFLKYNTKTCINDNKGTICDASNVHREHEHFVALIIVRNKYEYFIIIVSQNLKCSLQKCPRKFCVGVKNIPLALKNVQVLLYLYSVSKLEILVRLILKQLKKHNYCILHLPKYKIVFSY